MRVVILEVLSVASEESFMTTRGRVLLSLKSRSWVVLWMGKARVVAGAWERRI